MTLELEQTCTPDQFVGRSSCAVRLRAKLVRLSRFPVNILLQGETGTGKELAARILHFGGPRRTGPFIGVNCAAVHESLLESELFGHEAGAFTGAQRASTGLLRAANKGTILLDEVGDMGLPLQSKLLRVLEDRAVLPVGATRSIPVDVRVIAATHRDLAQAVRSGAFRSDLYYRLNVVTLTMPTLRQRREDIPILAAAMLQQVARLLDMPAKSLAPQAERMLMDYDWPGNVRELGNVIQRACVLGRGQVIEPADLREYLSAGGRVEQFATLDDIVAQHIHDALTKSGGVRVEAARMLGINRKRLWRMMNHYKISL